MSDLEELRVWLRGTPIDEWKPTFKELRYVSLIFVDDKNTSILLHQMWNQEKKNLIFPPKKLKPGIKDWCSEEVYSKLLDLMVYCFRHFEFQFTEPKGWRKVIDDSG